MAKTVIANTDSLKDSRTPINNNFTELYTGANIHAASEKNPPIDADEVGFLDSVASFALVRATWTQVKAFLKTYFDTLYSTAVKATGAEITTGTDDAKFATAKAIADSFIGELGGWINLGAVTYEGADAPTYTISFASDMTAILGAGMRIKLTDSTVKYFIITAVGAYSGGKTIITVYGGTDYTLSGGAMTLPHYSIQKAPFGFPLSPIQWTVEVTDVTTRSQASPTQNVWYNLGENVISIPIGCWNVSYQCLVEIVKAAASSEIQVTLSTANNSESDFDFTIYGYAVSADLTMVTNRLKTLLIAAKTPYYLNTRTLTASVAGIYNTSNGNSKMLLRAVCAYL